MDSFGAKWKEPVDVLKVLAELNTYFDFAHVLVNE
jgi:hypothetical protein